MLLLSRLYFLFYGDIVFHSHGHNLAFGVLPHLDRCDHIPVFIEINGAGRALIIDFFAFRKQIKCLFEFTGLDDLSRGIGDCPKIIPDILGGQGHPLDLGRIGRKADDGRAIIGIGDIRQVGYWPEFGFIVLIEPFIRLTACRAGGGTLLTFNIFCAKGLGDIQRFGIE